MSKPTDPPTRPDTIETEFPTVGFNWPTCEVQIGIGYLGGHRCYTVEILDGPRTLAHRHTIEPWLIEHGFTGEEANYMLIEAERELAGQADN